MSSKSKVIKFRAIDEEGRSYWPDMWPIDELEKRRRNNPVRFAYQYQNDPVALGGNELKTEWLHFIKREELPRPQDMFVVQGIDPSFSEAARADYFAIATLGRDASNQIYLLDVVHGHMGLPRQIEVVKQSFGYWRPSVIAIEGGPGRALYDTLVSATTLPVTSVQNAKRSKEDRVMSMSIPFQNRQVLVPGIWDEDLARLVPDTEGIKEFYEEWQAFPGGRYDDVLDAVQMAISHIIVEGVAEIHVRDFDTERPTEIDGSLLIKHQVCKEPVLVTQLGTSGGQEYYHGYCSKCQYEVKYSRKQPEILEKPKTIVSPEDQEKVYRELGMRRKFIRGPTRFNKQVV